jgi:hypothetical protein
VMDSPPWSAMASSTSKPFSNVLSIVAKSETQRRIFTHLSSRSRFTEIARSVKS